MLKGVITMHRKDFVAPVVAEVVVTLALVMRNGPILHLKSM